MRTMETIYEEMKEKLETLTGMPPVDGGDLELRLYAVAAQLFSLWEQAAFVLRQCFPQTAEGTYLDQHAQVRGVERRSGSRSVGTLRFSVTTAASRDLTVDAGTVCADSTGQRFETVEAGCHHKRSAWAFDKMSKYRPNAQRRSEPVFSDSCHRYSISHRALPAPVQKSGQGWWSRTARTHIYIAANTFSRASANPILSPLRHPSGTPSFPR